MTAPPAFIIMPLGAVEAHHLPDLVVLLCDAVQRGASLGFVPPLSPAEAEAYWQEVAGEVGAGTRLLLVAMRGARIVGSVQLALATKQNGRHRAEVQKLCVLGTARRQGIGQALMEAVEEAARRAGRSLLVLDTRSGDDAERLYTRLGYQRAGVIPAYTCDDDGALFATTLFYRVLGDGPPPLERRARPAAGA